MGIDTYTPAQLAAYLAGQKLASLQGLQVSGATQLDGGLGVSGSADFGAPLRIRGMPFAFSPGALAGGALVKIAEFDSIATGIAVASVVFNVPTGFRNLRYTAQARDTAAVAGLSNLVLQFNGDTGATHYWDVQNAATTSSATPSTSGATNQSAGRCGIAAQGNDSDAPDYAGSQGCILNYNQATSRIFWMWQATGQASGTGPYWYSGAGIWYASPLAPVTSIKFLNNDAATMKVWIALYGEA